MRKLSTTLRWAVAAVTLLFGAVCLVLALRGAFQWEMRTGLIVFATVQGGLYVAAAVSLVRKQWPILGALLVGLALVQLVYAAEVTPPGPLAGTLFGILVGGMGPTWLLAAAAAAIWAMSAPRGHAQVRP